MDCMFPKKKNSPTYVGVPAIFKLQLACKHINKAYNMAHGCYLVGSAINRPDWRDVDVVLIMDDAEFKREFPQANSIGGNFEFDTKWQLNSISMSAWLKEQTGLPIDFKIQPQTWANDRHAGKRRHPLGITYAPDDD